MFEFRKDGITKRHLEENGEALKMPWMMETAKLAEALTYIATGWEESPWAREIVCRARMEKQYCFAVSAKDRQKVIKKALSGYGIQLI